jgi:hypothetical protein
MSESSDYPRTTSPDFLTRCRPETAAFYRYWDEKRRGRLMPARRDIDPLEMKDWLPGIALVEICRDPDERPSRLIYRLIGTRVTRLRGREDTGKSVHEAFFGESLDAALENYRLVIAERKPVYDWDRTPSEDGLAREHETLLLPLSSDDQTVDMVLVYQETEHMTRAE